MKDNGYLSAALDLCAQYRMLPDGTTVLCAVSGGADSVCLLHWLYSLSRTRPLRVVAAHYDHNLRPDQSRQDADFVSRFTAQYCPGVELIRGSGQVADQAARTGRGIEETARELRYAFLQQAARQAGAHVIATAHNANDNAETLLLNLMRGCGLNGLAGIPPRRDNIVRPLLTTRREEILAYLDHHSLPHVEDNSNADDTYTRNRVRHQLVPVFERLCPDFIHQTTLTCARLTADEAELTAQAAPAAQAAAPIPGGLSIPVRNIAALPDPLAVRAVRGLLTRLRGTAANCTASHLHAVTALCRSQDPSAQRDLPHGILARRVYDRLELVHADVCDVHAATTLTLPGTVHFGSGFVTVRAGIRQDEPVTPWFFPLSRALVTQQLTLRPRTTGDMLTRPGRCRASVKKLMIDEKLPRHLRSSLPVLEHDGKVAAVVGLGPDAAFLPQPGQPCWHITYTDQNGKDRFP